MGAAPKSRPHGHQGKGNHNEVYTNTKETRQEDKKTEGTKNGGGNQRKREKQKEKMSLVKRTDLGACRSTPEPDCIEDDSPHEHGAGGVRVDARADQATECAVEKRQRPEGGVLGHLATLTRVALLSSSGEEARGGNAPAGEVDSR